MASFRVWKTGLHSVPKYSPFRCAFTSTVLVAPGARIGQLQMKVWLGTSDELGAGVAETNSMPLGKISVMVAGASVASPLLVMVMVKFTVVEGGPSSLSGVLVPVDVRLQSLYHIVAAVGHIDCR